MIIGEILTLVGDFIFEIIRYIVSIGVIVLAIYLGSKLSKRHKEKLAMQELNNQPLESMENTETEE